MWNKSADVIIPGVMGFDGLGRWDVLVPSILCLNMKDWEFSERLNFSDGNDENQIIKITHAPNFRGFKGSEFVIDAVEKLKKEGMFVELVLLEGVKNEVVKKVLFEQSDIHVEQLIGTGHGINAVEAMATGLPVVSNLDDENYTRPLRRWSYLNECPIVSSNPESF